jgi:hypothetical protein
MARSDANLVVIASEATRSRGCRTPAAALDRCVVLTLATGIWLDRNAASIRAVSLARSRATVAALGPLDCFVFLVSLVVSLIILAMTP